MAARVIVGGLVKLAVRGWIVAPGENKQARRSQSQSQSIGRPPGKEGVWADGSVI